MQMRELSNTQLEQVSGGILPAVGLVLGIVGAMEPIYDVYLGYTENRR